MATAVEQPSGFLRSHSTSDLSPLSYPPQRDSDTNGFDVPSFNVDFNLDTSSFLHNDEATSARSGGFWRTAQNEPKPAVTEIQPKSHAGRSRTSSLMGRPRSWFPGTAKTAGAGEPESSARPTTSGGEATFTEMRNSDKTRTESLANLTKRSWLGSTSANPPAPKRRPKSAHDDLRRDTSPPPPLPRGPAGIVAEQKLPKNKSSDSLKIGGNKALSRATSYITKIKAKQPKAFMKFNSAQESDNSCASSVVSLNPPSQSTDARTSQSTSGGSQTTVPDDLAADALPTMPRDSLWSSFKTLEVEYKGFAAKPVHQRILQIQNTLYPFLRNTMDHASTRKLSSEDVDRRAQILSKWWGAMLELLDGQGLYSVPGVDRPTLFEALTTMMMRPEWRQTTHSFRPLSERDKLHQVRERSWTESTGTTDSSKDANFLNESAEHNVRITFVTHLSKQMAFVVDKMSLRHLPLSLVSFSAKTCAYAFFFCPGVADILVRLWGLGPELIRRAGEELRLPRRDQGKTADIVSLFPANLAPLGWSSAKGMWNTMKEVPSLPVTVSRIPWTGPWVSRWKGRDTDLLFIFFKQFYILSDQFMRPGSSLTDRARSPGFALVQAQLLSIVDATIHRQTAITNTMTPPAPPTIEAMQLGQGMQAVAPGADASAMAMAVPPSNLMKGMAENRLVALLKDFLSDDAPALQSARHTFAESYASMIKAAVRKTSQYNHQACFTLCDFLEEILTIYDEHEIPIGSKRYIDWSFWMDVFKMILGSLNTMSEVRVMSFVFTIWDTVTRDPQRKASLCLDWLLSEETFDTFFNHWCPMVRAYYHRLLCWRICRDEGQGVDEVDVAILQTVAVRLEKNWAHYLYMKRTAESQNRFPPSTAPMLPTPAKKFMIIRQELNVPQPGLFLNFDSFAKTPGSEVLTGEDFDEAPSAKSDSKKRWSLFGKVLGMGNVSEPKGHNMAPSWDDESKDADEPRAARPAKISVSDRGDIDSACSSPMFEEQKYIFRFVLSWLQQPAMPLRDRILTTPRLPSPAQARLDFKGSPDRPLSPSIAPPFAPKKPTRTCSGSSEGGLIDEARNAVPIEATEATNARLTELSVGVRELEGSVSSLEESHMPLIEPIKPSGLYTKNAIYSGRALAEWGQVVFECNNFIERRRDEGVSELSGVEVPTLGVDTFRRTGS